jgi:hypothetical protein
MTRSRSRGAETRCRRSSRFAAAAMDARVHGMDEYDDHDYCDLCDKQHSTSYYCFNPRIPEDEELCRTPGKCGGRSA